MPIITYNSIDTEFYKFFFRLICFRINYDITIIVNITDDITVVINPPEKMAAQAKHFVEDLGYHILKIKMGISPQDDLEALRLIREAVGPDIRLRIDANQGYDYSQALFMLQEMKKYGVEAAEQCLPDWDLDGAARLRTAPQGFADSPTAFSLCWMNLFIRSGTQPGSVKQKPQTS